MSTSSIAKEFYVRDQAAFERLKAELATKSAPCEKVAEAPCLRKGKEKLAIFFISLNNIIFVGSEIITCPYTPLVW